MDYTKEFQKIKTELGKKIPITFSIVYYTCNDDKLLAGTGGKRLEWYCGGESYLAIVDPQKLPSVKPHLFMFKTETCTAWMFLTLDFGCKKYQIVRRDDNSFENYKRYAKGVLHNLGYKESSKI